MFAFIIHLNTQDFSEDPAVLSHCFLTALIPQLIHIVIRTKSPEMFEDIRERKLAYQHFINIKVLLYVLENMKYASWSLEIQECRENWGK